MENNTTANDRNLVSIDRSIELERGAALENAQRFSPTDESESRAMEN